MEEQPEFPSYVNVPPIAKTRSTSHLAPTPEHHRSVSYEETTTASTSTDSVPGVRIRSESSQVSCESPIPAPRKYVAAYEYKAQKDDELDLPLGSIVKLITDETHEDGWFRGELEGKVGLFPSNYARLLPETDNLVELSSEEIQLPHINTQLEDYQIGHGATATVFKVEIRTMKKLQGGQMSDGCIKAALKRFNRYTFRPDSSNELEQLKREANLVNGLSHNNIVRLLGICLEDPYFGLLLELCEGFSLRQVCRELDKDKPIPLGVLIDWAGQVAKGMAYLTKEGYVHRDLKADNVLVKEEVCMCFDPETMRFEWCTKCGRRPLDKLTLKITDFGVTRKMTADANRFSTAGTYAWLAPEAFRDGTWSEASDVWSYGVVMWEVLSREEPYQGQIPAAIAFQVAKKGQSLVINENCPEKWKDIMQQCWALEPSQRPKFYQLVQYFEDYARELEEKYVHVQRAPSIMAVKEIYTGFNKPKELEKMFRELYSETGFNRKNRQSIAPETAERKIYKGHKGKRPEITGPIGEVKHVFSVQKSNDKTNEMGNFRIKYNDEVSTGGTLPRLNGRQSTLSISSPDLFQLPEIVNGSSTVGSSASKISRQRAIRKKKNSNHNIFESPVVSPTNDETTGFAKIENADEVNEANVSKEPVKNGTLSKVFSKLPWRSHKRDSKDDDDKAGSISSRSSSTTSSHRIITGPASRSAAAPPFLDASSRSRAQSAADCWDESGGTKKNKVSPADKRPVKQTNLTERFVKDSDFVRPSILPPQHRKSALDQTIPPSPKNSPDSNTNFHPMPLNAGRRTTTTSSSDGAPSYEMLVNSQGLGHGHRGHIIQPTLSDYVPIASEQPTHYYMTNGQIYDHQKPIRPNVTLGNTGQGHGRPTYYPVGGGCDDYIQVAGSGGVMKATVGEVNNSPYSDMGGHLYGRNVQNPQYVQCKATPKPLKIPTLPIKIQSESNLGGMTTPRPQQLNGIENTASSLSLNEPPIFQAPLPPRVSMSPPTRLAPVLPIRDGSLSPNPRSILDEEILKKPEVVTAGEASVF